MEMPQFREGVLIHEKEKRSASEVLIKRVHTVSRGQYP